LYTILAILLIFLILIFSILLYLKQKNFRKVCLEDGICPSCNATSKSFIDQQSGKKFTVDVIKTKVIKSHGCSGVTEMEYRCDSCGLKEVHLVSNNCGCSL
jgi:hypothetical protein